MAGTALAKRTSSIKVNLTPELHERLREVAAQLGQTPATLASMAIGQYVANLASGLGATHRMVDAVANHLGPQMAEQFKQMTLAEAEEPAKGTPPAGKRRPAKKRSH